MARKNLTLPDDLKENLQEKANLIGYHGNLNSLMVMILRSSDRNHDIETLKQMKKVDEYLMKEVI